MKVLLDENLDHALRKLLGSHEVVTVTYMGWAGLKNGDLLQTAEDHGIDVLLTGDQTLTYENNLTGRRIAIVALSAIQLPIIKLHLQRILSRLTLLYLVVYRQSIAAHSPANIEPTLLISKRRQ